MPCTPCRLLSRATLASFPAAHSSFASEKIPQQKFLPSSLSNGRPRPSSICEQRTRPLARLALSLPASCPTSSLPLHAFVEELPPPYYCRHLLSAALSPDTTRTARTGGWPPGAAPPSPCISCTPLPTHHQPILFSQLPALMIRVDSMKCTPLPSSGCRLRLKTGSRMFWSQTHEPLCLSPLFSPAPPAM